METPKNKRTNQQNESMHLYFTKLAKKLNEAGLDQRRVLKEEICIPWSPEAVKEQLWKPVQRIFIKKDSTTQLERKEVSEVYDILNRHLSETHRVAVPFPSERELSLMDINSIFNQ